MRRSYGTGSLFESSDGRSWYGKWRDGDRQIKRRVGPKRSPGEADGLTRAQAEARLRELMAEVTAEDVRASRVVIGRGLTIAELGARYVAYARDHKGLKAGTLTEYESVVRVHLVPFFGEVPVRSIGGRRVEDFAAYLRTKTAGGKRGGKPLAPKTIENVLGSLAVLFNFAVKKKLLPVSPMDSADLPRLTDNDAPIEGLSFLEPAEVQRLIEAARPGAYRALDRALYALAAYSGLRQGELRGLRWENVDFGQSRIHVMEGLSRGRRSSPKGKRRRSPPLAPTAAKALLELRAASPWTAPGHPVFATASTGKPMATTQLKARFEEALLAAKVPRVTFHDLRHTFGTTMARKGVPVTTIQAWMGHADLQTTQIYMHYAPAADDAAIIEAAFASGTNRGTNLSAASVSEITSANRKAA